MSTNDHFSDLISLIDYVIPFFWEITSFLAACVCVAFVRQIIKYNSISWKNYWVVVALLPTPILVIWLGAYLIHFDDTTVFPNDSKMGSAPYWPQYLLLVILISLVIFSLKSYKKLKTGRALYGTILTLELWVILCAVFIANLAVCGDYYRFIY
jgi:uncharacterized membrane protein YhaH (DUF805 family)